MLTFPCEAAVLGKAKNKDLDVLRQDGWPEFRILKGKDARKTLYDIIHRPKNAVGHHHLIFSSDSFNRNDVEITFEN